MKKILYTTVMLGAMLGACHDDLNQYPNIEETSESVYANPENYLGALAKCYASYVTAGQEKGGGNADLSSNNGYDYIRCYFNLQEAGTDEIGSTWTEGDKVTNLSFLSWDANDPWVADMYYRCYYTISLCNEFLKNCTIERAQSFGETYTTDFTHYNAEARFLRALAYFHALDLFKNIPFADESTIGSSNLPKAMTAQEAFNFIEKELKECSENMLSIDECEYGRAPRAAAWMLLARLYLNVENYGLTARYTDCMTYCQKVIDEGYEIEDNYASLFNADNDKRVGKGHEIIFPLVVDHEKVMSWGATTYLVCGALDTDYGPTADSLGLTPSSRWSMFRVRGAFSALFDSNDGRGMLFPNTNQFMTSKIEDRSSGYFMVKWSNKNDAGAASCDSGDGVDTDLPLFRLADAYLMYAECAARTASADLSSTALGYVNELRNRVGADEVSTTDLTATINNVPFRFFLDERARELSWELVRRTDLIRFGCFTGNGYLWEWKGKEATGKSVDSKYNFYPIPASELSANPNLSNENY